MKTELGTIEGIRTSLLRVASALLTERLGDSPDDWNFRRTTGVKDRRMVLRRIEAANERVRRRVINLVALADALGPITASAIGAESPQDGIPSEDLKQERDGESPSRDAQTTSE